MALGSKTGLIRRSGSWGESTDSGRQSSLPWALLQSHLIGDFGTFAQQQRGSGGHGVFLGHLSCWHLPGRNRVPGPEPTGHRPDLPPRHRLVQRGQLNLPRGSSDPGRKAQRILVRKEQDEATQAEVPDAPWGCHQAVVGWLGCRIEPVGGGPFSLTSSLGPNEKLYSL